MSEGAEGVPRPPNSGGEGRVVPLAALGEWATEPFPPSSLPEVRRPGGRSCRGFAEGADGEARGQRQARRVPNAVMASAARTPGRAEGPPGSRAERGAGAGGELHGGPDAPLHGVGGDGLARADLVDVVEGLAEPVEEPGGDKGRDDEDGGRRRGAGVWRRRPGARPPIIAGPRPTRQATRTARGAPRRLPGPVAARIRPMAAGRGERADQVEEAEGVQGAVEEVVGGGAAGAGAQEGPRSDQAQPLADVAPEAAACRRGWWGGFRGADQPEDEGPSRVGGGVEEERHRRGEELHGGRPARPGPAICATDRVIVSLLLPSTSAARGTRVGR